MARVKRGVTTRTPVTRRSSSSPRASSGARPRTTGSRSERLEKSLQYAYRDRRQKKRDFRGLWIQRINAAVREHGITYSRFIAGLKRAEIELDRKVLAAIAYDDPAAFAIIVEQVKQVIEHGAAEDATVAQLAALTEHPTAPAA